MGYQRACLAVSHVPLLIEAGEWREIAQGIEQRARSWNCFGRYLREEG